MVSHSLGLIEEICDRAIWLEHGRLRASGLPRRVIDSYRQSVAEAEGLALRQAKEQQEGSLPTAPSAQEDTAEESTAEEDATGLEDEEVLRWAPRKRRSSKSVSWSMVKSGTISAAVRR